MPSQCMLPTHNMLLRTTIFLKVHGAVNFRRQFKRLQGLTSVQLSLLQYLHLPDINFCSSLYYTTYTSKTSASAAISSPIAIPPDFNPISTSQKSVHISVLAKEKSETISYWAGSEHEYGNSTVQSCHNWKQVYWIFKIGSYWYNIIRKHESPLGAFGIIIRDCQLWQLWETKFGNVYALLDMAVFLLKGTCNF